MRRPEYTYAKSRCGRFFLAVPKPTLLSEFEGPPLIEITREEFVIGTEGMAAWLNGKREQERNKRICR